MGFDPVKQDRQYSMVVKITAAPFLIIAGVGSGISGLVKSIGKMFTFKDKDNLKQFRVDMGTAFKKYIEAEIQTAESSMTTTYNRELRLKAITTH